jgi:hypothetical protein
MHATRLTTLLLLCISFQMFFSFQGAGQSFDCEEELFSKKDRKTRLFGYVNALGEYRIPPVFLKAMPFVGRNAVVQQGKMFGVINCEGILVVPADYEEIASFSNGKGWVRTGGLWGLIDVRGRMLIAPQYEEVKEINPFSGTQTWVRKKGLWGLISKENGRVLVTPQYDDVSGISDSAGICRKNSVQDLVYFGDGRVIISGMRSVRKISRNLFAFQSNGKNWGAFNSLAYLLIRPEWNSLVLNGGLVQVEKDGLFGLRNLKGNEILPARFSYIQEFREGFSAVREKSSWQILNGKCEFILPEGSYEFTQVINGKVSIVSKGNSFGIWNPSSKSWVRQPEFAQIRASLDGLWLEAKTKNGPVLGFDCTSQKFGTELWDSLSVADPASQVRAYLNKKVCITQASGFEKGTFYDSIRRLSSGYLVCSESGQSGLFGNSGQMVLPLEYSDIQSFQTPSGLIFSIKKEGLEGISGPKGQILLPLRFQKVRPAKGPLFVVQLDSRWGLADPNGYWILENKYDSVATPVKVQDEIDFPMVVYKKGKGSLINSKGQVLAGPREGTWFSGEEGALFLKEGNSYSLWTSQGKPAGEIRFDQFLPFSEGTAPVLVQGKWGFVNHSGKLVIPARFEEVLPYKSGIAYAKENGFWGVLKKNGSWLVKPSGISVETNSDGKRHLVLP